jgi:hypothetical protein
MATRRKTHKNPPPRAPTSPRQRRAEKFSRIGVMVFAVLIALAFAGRGCFA